MKECKYLLDFCTGCGFCQSICGVKLEKNEKGFLVPSNLTKKQMNYLNDICMSSGAFWRDKGECSIWGNTVIRPFYAYSTNEIIRKKASSGGLLTEIASYLLKSGRIDAVIQIRTSKYSPVETETVVSETEEDVRCCAGSRYTASSPLLHIADLLSKEKRYAFIGKPCDVQTVRNWQRKDPEKGKSIIYLLSFLCAGIPSQNAEYKLLDHLNTNEKDCTKLTYRGNGWPGYAVAYSEQGQTGQMSYEESWGKILGRDVAMACRFCFDGIGEAADISCGDGWYIKNKKPDFTENDGRNVVFVRTTKGLEILQELQRERKIQCVESEKIYEELSVIQSYQYNRRTTMRERILALKLNGRATPAYDMRVMKELGEHSPISLRVKMFLGTLKRLYKKRI